LQQVREDLTVIPKQKSSLPCYLAVTKTNEYKIKLKSSNYKIKLASKRTTPNCQKSVMNNLCVIRNSCHCGTEAAHTRENNKCKKMQLDTLTHCNYVEMEVTRKLDEPDIAIGNRVFMKNINYTLNIHRKKKS